MVKRATTSAQKTSANLTPDEMRSAIPKLERRIRDLEAFDPRSLQKRNDPRIEALENKLSDTIAEVFGHDTLECHRFAPSSLDGAGYNMVRPTAIEEVIGSVTDSVAREISNIRTIIELFNEKLSDGGNTPTTRAIRSFGDLELHPEIERACAKLFEDGHYSESVEAACKVLDLLVKIRSMEADRSGTDLMQMVFSTKSPILKYSEQATESERSEQQGMMFLFAGAMLAIRNPRAHGLIKDHPVTAIEYLSFLSMLAKSLDRTFR